MRFILFILMFTLALAATRKIGKNDYVVEILWSSDNSAQPKELILTCNTSASQHESVYWKKDLKWAGNGKALKITIRGTPDAGNYTCWSNTTHEFIDYKYIKIEKKGNSGEIQEPILQTVPEQNTSIYCEAKNYSGKFTCFWNTQSQNSELKFNIRSESESQTKSSSETLICENPQNNYGETNPGLYSSSCRRENPCSFTEDYQEIMFSIDVSDKFVHESHSIRFFMNDIIKPDISQCQIAKNGTLTWSPPPTWSTPVTYFGLIYQIQLVSSNNNVKICEVDHSSLLQYGDSLRCVYKLCRFGECFIRSRDRYHSQSSWSNWSKCRSSNKHRNHKNNQPDNFTHEVKGEVEKCKC